MSKLENEALYGLLLEVYILIVSPVFFRCLLIVK